MSVTVSVSVQGLDGAINRMRAAHGKVTGQTSRLLDLSIAQAKRTVAAGTKVRTGRAQKGWRTRSTGPLSRQLYNDVPYIPFLVLGTRFMAPRAMLVAALAKAQQQMTHDLAQSGAEMLASVTKEY